MNETTIILLAAMAGVFTQRVVGFGMPIIVLPVALLYFHPPPALTIVLFTGILSSIVIINELKTKTRIDLKIIRAIIPASIVGIVIGSYILSVISKEALQIFLGISIIIFLNIQRYFLPEPKHEIKVDKNIHMYGLLSGFFKSTVGLSAAPLVVWLRFYIIKPNQIRLLLAYYFFIMNVVAIISIQAFENNTLSDISWYMYVLLVPAVILANFLGSAVAKRVNTSFYNKLAYLVLIAAGAITLFSGVAGYI
ncbi:MAG TPA: sulfite exporter TauE/SafE family protein [Candidatus Saccharimonadales bacterium]|nr:sulfite exporter TauE/SafE family protein [Candidatus Saccharimonadales bacterium]